MNLVTYAITKHRREPFFCQEQFSDQYADRLKCRVVGMASEIREGRQGFWQGAIRRQAESGLPVARFCRREGLHPVTFYGWRRKLQRKAGVIGDEGLAENRPTPGMPALVPVRLLESPDSVAVEVVSPRGWVLRVQAGTDTDNARRVLHLLQEIE
jgi:hypothetical protein